VVRPGATIDAGSVQLDSLVPVTFQNLGGGGVVRIAGTGGADVLVAEGSGADDRFDLAATSGDIRLTRPVGAQVVLQTTGVESLELDGLEGNDRFVVNLPQPYAALTVRGGGPGSSDTLQVNDRAGLADTFDVTLAATPTDGQINLNLGATVLDYVGVEHLTIAASDNTLDALTINEPGGDNVWTVSGGPAIPQQTDRVQIEGRETIDYTLLNSVTLNNFTGVDVFRIYPTGLTQYNNAAGSFTVAGDGDDVLELVGTANDDSFSQTVATRFTVNGQNIDLVAGSLDTVRLVGGDGDDAFGLNVATLDGGVTAVVVEGGAPAASDTLSVTVPGAATVAQGAESTAGTVTAVGAAAQVQYSAVESLTVTAVAASTLTVVGTNDADTLAIGGPGAAQTVWVNDGTVLHFANFNNVALQGQFGDDRFSITPLVGVTITAQGGDPTGSDAAVVNATAATTVSSLTADGAVVTVTGFGVVTLQTVESLLVTGGATGVPVTVQGEGDADVMVHTPGVADDAGRVQVDALLAVDYAGATSLTLDGQGGADEVQAVGTAGSDTFGVAGVATITLNSRIVLNTTAVESYRLRGLGGDDTFNVTPVGGIGLAVEGDEPGGSDVLNYTAVNATLVDLGAGTLDDAVLAPAPNVTYTGIETLNLNAAGQNLTVNATGGDDTVAVTPLTGTSGVLQANGAAPVVNYSNLGGLFTVDLLSGGEDRLVVHGNATGETITVTPTTVAASGQTITYANAEALAVFGHEGSDTFAVTASADTEIFIDGGDPVGVTSGDRLTLTVPAGAGTTTFAGGPESDEGAFAFAGAGGIEPVSYDHLEAVTNVDLSGVQAGGGALIIQGTNADNDITIVGTGAASLTVSIDGGPAVPFSGVSSLQVDGYAGDDDIEFELNALNLSGNITVRGDAVGGVAAHDRVTVRGSGAADTATWDPAANQLTFTGGEQLTLAAVEDLVYDGEGQDETLIVSGTGTFVVRPGATIDAGSVQLDSLVPVTFQNLGGGGRPDDHEHGRGGRVGGGRDGV
jgi:hypothetical protein